MRRVRFGGLGYGGREVLTDHWNAGFGADMKTALAWMGKGAGGGALLPAAVIVAVVLGALWLILMGIGFLLSLLAG